MDPTSGFFTLIHHEGPLIEWSDDITKRHRVIDRDKPPHERATRHRCIVRVPEARLPRLYAALASYQRIAGQALAEYERIEGPALTPYAPREGPTMAQYERITGQALAKYQHIEEQALAAYQRITADILADPATLALVRELVPDCPWDGTRIVFPT